MNRAIVLCLLLAGCAGVPSDPSKMTPDQLKAAARDKNASVACWNGKTAAGNVTIVYANLDQAPRLGSTATVESDCRTTVVTTAHASAPASAASAP